MPPFYDLNFLTFYSQISSFDSELRFHHPHILPLINLYLFTIRKMWRNEKFLKNNHHVCRVISFHKNFSLLRFIVLMPEAFSVMLNIFFYISCDVVKFSKIFFIQYFRYISKRKCHILCRVCDFLFLAIFIFILLTPKTWLEFLPCTFQRAFKNLPTFVSQKYVYENSM